MFIIYSPGRAELGKIVIVNYIKVLKGKFHGEFVFFFLKIPVYQVPQENILDKKSLPVMKE